MSDDPQDELGARLRQLFREELQDNLSILASGLAELEGRPARETEQELVPVLFRAAHSLKGAAHSAGVGAAVEPCRRLEELFALLRDGERVLDDEALATFAGAVADLRALDQQLAPTEPATNGEHGPQTGQPAPMAPRPGDRAADVRARVDVSDLDDLVGRAGALVSSTARLHALADDLASERDADETDRSTSGSFADRAAAAEREIGHTARGVVAAAQHLRMQPMSEVTAGLEHTVRELARSMDKQAELTVRGGDLRVDRDVGDALREPLLHLVRNAVDHGLEPPQERLEHGKPPVGSVRIEATLEGGRIRVVVADDGRGIDVAALRTVANHRAGTDAQDLDVDIAFRPGVSTAPVVSDVSGRGVGLDAVRARVEALGGTVHLRSAGDSESAGADADAVGGTQAVVHVPMTLAVVRIVLVDVGGELVGLPGGAVERVYRADPAALQLIDGRLLLVSEDRSRPVAVLGDALGLPVPDADGSRRTIVALVDEERLLLVDRVDTELEAVLQKLPPRAGGAGLVLGAVVLPDVRAALVVNPAACLRAAATATVPTPAAVRPHRPVVLLAEDTLTTRALERSILVGGGYEVIDVADGAAAWEVLNDRHVDVVVSDVDMPRMGGIELCRSIRSSARLGQIPVVLVTSMGTDDDRRRGVEAGANAYLVKSAFDQATLLDAVRRVL